MESKLIKNRKGILYCIYLYFLGLGLSEVAQANTFVIGVEDISYYPYFDFISGNTSFVKALFEQFANDNGYQISYLPLPIKQFRKWLHEENIDFKFPDNTRWQEASNIHQLKIHLVLKLWP